MQRATLNLDTLAVETFATTPATTGTQPAAEKMTAATSCPHPPPYCTC